MQRQQLQHHHGGGGRDLDPELLFLILHYLHAVPELQPTVQLLSQQLRNVGALGEAISWNGQRRCLSMQDLLAMFPSLPPNHLPLLLRQTSQLRNNDAMVAVTRPSLLKSLSDGLSSLPVNEELGKAFQQLSQRLSEVLSHQRSVRQCIGATVFQRNNVQQTLMALATDGVDNEECDHGNATLHRIGKQKELTRMENEIASLHVSLNTITDSVLGLQEKLSNRGFLLNPLQRGLLLSTSDFMIARQLGFTNHHGKISCGGGKYLQLSASKQSNLIRCNFNHLYTISGHMTNPAYCCIFDQTGKYILTGADDYLVKIWDVRRGQLVRVCRGHMGYISFIAVSPDNAVFASGCTMGVVRIWRLKDGVCIHVLKHTAPVNWLCFDATTGALASCSDDGQCIVWDLGLLLSPATADVPLLRAVMDRKEKKSSAKNVGVSLMEGIVCSSDRRSTIDEMIIQNDSYGNLFHWSSAIKGQAQMITSLPLYHVRDVNSLQVEDANDSLLKVVCCDVAPHGDVLVTGCEDGVARVWRMDAAIRGDWPQRSRHRGSSDLKTLETLKTVLSPQTFAKFERVTKHLLLRLEGHVSIITDVFFSGLGDRVLTASIDGNVRIWSLSKDYTKSVHIVLDICEEDEVAPAAVAGRHKGRLSSAAKRAPSIFVYDVRWTIDYQRVVTIQSIPQPGNNGNNNQTQPTRLKVWDAMTGDLLRIIRMIGERPCRTTVAHPLASNIMMTGGDDGFVSVWDIDAESCIRQMRIFYDDMQPAMICDLSFSPDGSYVAVTDGNGRLTVLGLESPQLYSGKVLSEQYFSTDYAPIVMDERGFVIDVGTQLPVHEAPVGCLCRMNGNPYEKQLAPLPGPQPLPVEAMEAELQTIEDNAKAAAAEMDRVLRIFNRNKTRGRVPRRYNQTCSAAASQSFGTRAPATSSSPAKNRERSSRVQYIPFDINQYQPSSDDSKLDSDYNEEHSINEADFMILNSDQERSYWANHTRRSMRGRRRNRFLDDEVVLSSESDVDPNHPRLRRRHRSQRGREAHSGEMRAARLRRFDGHEPGGEDGGEVDIDNDNEGFELEDSDASQERRHRKRREKKRSQGKIRNKDERTAAVSSAASIPDELESLYGEDFHVNDQENKEIRDADSSKRKSGKSRKSKTKTTGRYVPIGLSLDRSWLQEDIQREASYVPQMGDHVIYFPQGHRTQLRNFAEDVPPPWLSFPQKYPFVECLVTNIDLQLPTEKEYRRCDSLLAIVTLVIITVPSRNVVTPHGQYIAELVEPRSTRHSTKAEHVFKVTLRQCGLSDFLVPKQLFLRSIRLPWHMGIRVLVTYREEGDFIRDEQGNVHPHNKERVFRDYEATVIRLSNAEDDWPHSPWEALEISWKENNQGPGHVEEKDNSVEGGFFNDGDDRQATSSSTAFRPFDNTTGESDRTSPWDVRVISEAGSQSSYVQLQQRYRLPTIDAEDQQRILHGIEREILPRESYQPFMYEVDANVFEDYYSMIAVPMYVDLIIRRLRNGYYRQMASLEFDINLLFRNCAFYNSNDSSFVQDARSLCDTLLHIVKGEGQSDSESVDMQKKRNRTQSSNHRNSNEEAAERSGRQTRRSQSSRGRDYSMISDSQRPTSSNEQDGEKLSLRIRRNKRGRKSSIPNTLDENFVDLVAENVDLFADGDGAAEEAALEPAVLRLRVSRNQTQLGDSLIHQETERQTRKRRRNEMAVSAREGDLLKKKRPSRKSRPRSMAESEDEERQEEEIDTEDEEEEKEDDQESDNQSENYDPRTNSDGTDGMDASFGVLSSDGAGDVHARRKTRSQAKQRTAKPEKPRQRAKANKTRALSPLDSTSDVSPVINSKPTTRSSRRSARTDREDADGADHAPPTQRRKRRVDRGDPAVMIVVGKRSRSKINYAESDDADDAEEEVQDSDEASEEEQEEEEAPQHFTRSRANKSQPSRKPSSRSMRVVMKEAEAEFQSEKEEESESDQDDDDDDFEEAEEEDRLRSQSATSDDRQPRSRTGRPIKAPASYFQEVNVELEAKRRQRQEEERRPARDDVLTQNVGKRISPELRRQLQMIIDYSESIDEEQLFAEPVDVDEAPGYYDIVQEPMDLSTIRDKFGRRLYQSIEELMHDINLMYSNCEAYNVPNSKLDKEARRQRRLMKKFVAGIASL